VEKEPRAGIYLCGATWRTKFADICMKNDTPISGELLTETLVTNRNFQEMAVDLVRVSCPTCRLLVTPDVRFCPNDSTPIKKNESARSIPNYEFIQLLGSGGMGHVYEAEHVVLKNRVAIKILKPNLVETSAFMRFQQEAKATSQLKHPNIVWVYDCGLSQLGEPYMIMDLIKGQTLDALLKHGPLPVTESLAIVRQICQGMIRAHDRGILHRDLKPSNVMLEDQGETRVARILDFGIAKILQDNEAGSNNTRTGEIFGTPAYMSPEQIAGQKLDQRSDVYAVGCILYELLTGQPPVIGKSAMEIMYKRMNEVPLPLSQASLGKKFPADLDKIVSRSLAKEPSDRFATMEVMVAAIDNFTAGRALEFDQNASALTPKKQTNKAKNKLALIGGFSLLAMLVVGAIAIVMKTDEPDKSQVTIQRQSDPDSPTTTTVLELMENGDNASFLKTLHDNTMVSNIRNVPIHITDPALVQVGKFVNVDTVNLSDCTNITAEGLTHLVRLPKLITLYLPNTKLGDECISVINKMSHLDHLDMSGSRLTDLGLNNLSASLPLTRLRLQNIPITDDAVQRLSRFKHLRHLRLDHCPNITVKALSKLAGSEMMDLALGNTNITSDVYKPILAMPELTDIFLNDTNIDDHVLHALLPVKHLKYLDVTHCPGSTAGAVTRFKEHHPNCRIISDLDKARQKSLL